MSFDLLYTAVSWVLLRWHSLLDLLGLDPDAGLTWTLSIVLLVVTARLLLVRVFVGQLRHQRRLQELQPRIAELRRKYGHDRAELQRHTLELHRSESINPLAGCLPLLLQLPVFVGLMHVLRHLAAAASPAYQAAHPQNLHLYGFTDAQTASASGADLAGAPLAASFANSAHRIHDVLGGDVAVTRLLVVGLLALAAGSTLATQLLARAGSTSEVATVQRVLLVIAPLGVLASGLLFDLSLGVVVYLLTSNLWTLAQQFVVVRTRRTPAPTPTQRTRPRVAAKRR